MSRGSTTVLNDKCGNYVGKMTSSGDKTLLTIYGRDIKDNTVEFGAIHISKRTLLDSIQYGPVPRSIGVVIPVPISTNRTTFPNILGIMFGFDEIIYICVK